MLTNLLYGDHESGRLDPCLAAFGAFAGTGEFSTVLEDKTAGKALAGGYLETSFARTETADDMFQMVKDLLFSDGKQL